jgi:peptidoglycan/LPS O-acetylase OafA/YrhL
MVVLMILGRALGELLPIPAILLIALPAIWLAAEASFRWVERPSIRAGRVAAEAIQAIAVSRNPRVPAPN